MPQTGPSPVEEIKERLDVADVLGEYVRLIPAGPSRYKVLCPFHNEKTPSLMVSKDRQAWHCFGCGKGGDIFSFVQEIENIDFPEALRILAKKANVQLRAVDPKLQNQKTKLYDILKLTAAFYRKILTDHPAGAVARAYLEKRNVGSETAEEFQLGYSPTTWDGLLTFLKNKGHAEQDIFDAGLVIRRDKGVGYYDRFRGRLMFPIWDANGTVVGFGGRILEEIPGDASSNAKYINTPETLVYSKGSVLYGLDKAKSAIKQADLAVLVEGYMDCIASHQAGVTNVVAVSGTALTQSQVKLLKRSTSNIALAFDADLAGGEAARRGIDQALAAEMRVTVITIPDAKDPDELIQRDSALWRNAIASAQRIVDYSFDRAFAHVDPTDVDDKKKIAKQLLPVIARLPDPVEQSHYLQQLAGRLKTDETALRDALKRTSKPAVQKSVSAGEETPARSVAGRAVLVAERLIALALAGPAEFFGQAIESLDPAILPDGELQALYKQAVLYYSQNHTFDTRQFQSHVAKELPMLGSRLAGILVLGEHEFSEFDDIQRQAELHAATSVLRRQAVTEELRSIEERLRSAEAGHAGEDSDQLLRRMNELTDELRSLES